MRAAAPARAPDMSTFNDRSNPCFSGDSMVHLPEGGMKLVAELQQGDKVLSGMGQAAEVVCVVKTWCPATTQIVHLSEALAITPWHPVRVEGRWHFPCNLKAPVVEACPALYSFVLRSGHTMLIGGIECVTLGHGMNEKVVQHPYLGTRRVIDDLEALPGWTDGLIEFNDGCMVRDFSWSGLLMGFDSARLRQERKQCEEFLEDANVLEARGRDMGEFDSVANEMRCAHLVHQEA